MDVPLIGGVAGGVGTTTLARALQAIDGGIYPGAAPVDLLVARSTLYSLGCAQRAAAATPAPPVLAVIADIPRVRLPGQVKARLRMTEPHLAGLVVVPYVETWPQLEDPYQDAERVLTTVVTELPKPLRGFAAAVHQLVAQLKPRLLTRSGPIGYPAYPPADLRSVSSVPQPAGATR